MGEPIRTRRGSRRAVAAALVVVALAAALDACGSQRDREANTPDDPTLAALKADPMGTREPEGFTLVDATGTPADESGIGTGKPTQASWVRDFRSTRDARDSAATLEHVAAAAEHDGWTVGYAGSSDVSATKTIDGEPAVLYVSIDPATTQPLAGSEEYTLQISLRS